MHFTANYALISWYHVSGGVILPCDHHKHVSFTVFLSLLYRIGDMFFKH